MFRQSLSGERFTLIELLVVIAIIAILIALLCRRCRKFAKPRAAPNVKTTSSKMGLAVANHHDVYKAYPSGGTKPGSTPLACGPGAVPASVRLRISCPNPGAGPTQILPYIEQQALWQDPNDLDVGGTPIKTYICPRAEGQRSSLQSIGPARMSRAYMMDYSGSGGQLAHPDIGNTSNTFDGALIPSRLLAPRKYRPHEGYYGRHLQYHAHRRGNTFRKPK